MIPHDFFPAHLECEERMHKHLRAIALVALVALLWLFAGQRRRAGQKYEGLRTLR